MSQADHDSPVLLPDVTGTPSEQAEYERREFLHKAALATGAVLVGAAGSYAGAQPVRVADTVFLDRVNLNTRLTGVTNIQRNAQQLAQSAMLLRGLEIVNTLNPGAAASFDLSFGLKW
ncbi:hypothetical protein SAMN04488058_10377 [Deinococcus reticulitermitis]|uniref:Uncharacterized protein n=1 Tax=Deinococcus reticulitermitis TaxID=856736 RepID=A0A1H6VK25_9DEIO|nr:hypothetical protein [Deinococcus reticulitermitis]SEJ00575.1 hypothetical protein SAMN04488058_10377 [Deinococcus reticulitermitis]